MALIKCPECEKKVSDQAIMCPHCGFGVAKHVKEQTAKLEKKPADINPELLKLKDDEKNPIDRREDKRINLKMTAKINNEVAMLFNISRSGIMLSTPIIPTIPTVHLTLQAGEQTFNIKGIIRWVSRKRSISNLKDIGISIVDAPQEYYAFLNELLSKNS
jgi:uncharacterized Zn finger protein (UPF0148 family)